MKIHLSIGVLCTWIFFLIYSLPVLGQVDNPTGESLKAQYQKGKTLYEQQQYKEALEVFRPLSRISQTNPYAPYASFFFGLSAFRQGDYALAKNMFLQLKDKYPNWENTGQVNYWLANTYFEQKDYQPALSLLDKTENKKAKEEAQTMKRFYLSAVKSDSVLQSLLREYPKDQIIAEALVKNLSQSFFDANKQALADSLAKVYKLDMGALGAISQSASIKKEVYNVAALLPFLYKKLSPGAPRQGNQFVLDLYQGMKLAAEDLNQEGINIRLHAYDTRRSYSDTRKLLAQQEMQNMDVMIGPLYPEPYQAVSEFSMKNKVYMFNPLSDNPKAIGENPFSYLIKPSVITEAKAAAQLAAGKLEAKEALIIGGISSEDSMRVRSFTENFQKDTSYHVRKILFRNFYRADMDSLVSDLKRMEENNKKYVLYVASADELVITNVVSAVVMAGGKMPLIGNGKWLGLNNVSYDQLEELNVYLLDATYTNYDNGKLKTFLRQYRERQYEVPSQYVLTGYDMMYYIGQMLNRYGIYFQEFFKEEQHVNSLFYYGYDYFNANDNQRIPVVRFEDSELTLVEED